MIVSCSRYILQKPVSSVRRLLLVRLESAYSLIELESAEDLEKRFGCFIVIRWSIS